MEWFAITSAVTTSLAWAGADARARGAWVSVADVCRQTMTGGRIAEAKEQLKRVCRLARVGVGDLRAAIDAGLLVWDGNDLVVAGWDHAKEREAARAVQRARDHRAQKREADAPDLGDTSVSAAVSSAADPAERTPSVSSTQPPTVRTPFAYAPPYAEANCATEKRREEKTRGDTPPSPPQDVPTRVAHAARAATAATALAQVSEVIREPSPDTIPPESRSAPRCVRERQANAETVESADSMADPPKPSPDLAPKRSSVPARRAVRLAALGDDALGTITALGGCLRGPGGTDYAPEWQRELAGLDAREVLGICWSACEPIRLPSGLRRALSAWRALPADERRAAVAHACRAYDLPMSRRPEVSP